MVIDARGIRSVEVSLSSAYDEYAQEADRAEQVVQYKQVVDDSIPLSSCSLAISLACCQSIQMARPNEASMW